MYAATQTHEWCKLYDNLGEMGLHKLPDCLVATRNLYKPCKPSSIPGVSDETLREAPH